MTSALAGEMPGLARLPHSVRVGRQMVQIELAQLLLVLVPLQYEDGVVVQAHLSVSSFVVLAGALAAGALAAGGCPSGRRVSSFWRSACRAARRLAEHLVQLGEVQLLVVDEAVRVIQVGSGRQHVRVLPQPVAPVDPPRVRERGPQPRGVPQPARPQLEADQRGEGLLGRAAGRPAPAQRLAQRVRRRSGAASAASCTTASTQPSTSASAVSRRASAAFCSGVSSGWNMPCCSASCSCSGCAGSNWPTTSSSLLVSTLMPRA